MKYPKDYLNDSYIREATLLRSNLRDLEEIIENLKKNNNEITELKEKIEKNYNKINNVIENQKEIKKL